MKKLLGWIGNIGYWAAFILGIRGNVYCFNIFKFMVWVMTICAVLVFLVLCMSKAEGKPSKVKDINWTWPAWFDAAQDLIMASILAGLGHFTYAALLIIQQMCEYWIRTDKPDEKDDEPKSGKIPIGFLLK